MKQITLTRCANPLPFDRESMLDLSGSVADALDRSIYNEFSWLYHFDLFQGAIIFLAIQAHIWDLDV
jgi:hypothetical protein